MPTIASAFVRDANHVPITSLGLSTLKSITYAASTTGAIGTSTLFTVTGIIAVRVFAFVGASLTSGGVATLAVGVSGTTDGFLPGTGLSASNATDLDTNDVWTDAADGDYASIELFPAQRIISQDIIQTIAGATITGGNLKYYAIWAPISEDGNLVAA